MSLLVLESSSPEASWAWVENGTVAFGGPAPGRASSALAAAIAASPVAGRRAERILAGVGPGSFSGIRSAIALAQGMARAWKCPVEPVRSSHAVAHELRDAPILGVFADAKRGHYFFTEYALGRMAHPSKLIPRDSLKDYLSHCTRAVACGPLDGVPESMLPQASSLAAAWLLHGAEPALPLEPVYLHEQVVPGANRQTIGA